MATPSAAAVTPAKAPSAPVDIATIEALKENIVPLQSGRSASHLAALSSSSRSGLGHKLDAEHARYAAQISAVDEYEQTGSWEDGRDGLSLDEVQQLAEDPLDISHQYVRFIVASYPAGASASNKLVPVLEATTRKFLGDGRYTNDPRYFRLWAHYARNMESPEECYRFLFAKGVGEKLAALYEEYAKVLEAKHKRKQADTIYLLGINRRATPLDRLKRSYLDFQARMLVAPPVPAPSPPRPTPSSSSDSRSILSSSSSSRPAGLAPATGGTGVPPKGNGSAFAVFRDESGEKSKEAGAEWDDFGTVKSRQRENNEEKKEWAGEVMPQKGGGAKVGGGFKLEVYRDETASSTHAHIPPTHAPEDVFTRSTRAPTEAESLRLNPFKNYSAREVALTEKDPLEGLEVLPRSSSSSSSSSRSKSGAAGEKTRTSSSSSSSRSKSSSASSSSAAKPSSSSSAPASSSAAAHEKPKERVAVFLRALYPAAGEEYSFEELKARSRGEAEWVKGWGGWEWAAAWDAMAEEVGGRYEVDGEGRPVLWAKDGAPLYAFLPRPAPPTPEPAPAPAAVEAPSSPSPASPSAAADDEEEPNDSYTHRDPHRPPSPTINTRAANALLDHLFAKTLDFTKVNSTSRSTSDSDEDEEGEEPSTDESDDEDDDTPFGGVPGAGSQYSTQGASQPSELLETQDENAFVPFSQTRSQMGDDSAWSAQGGSQLPASQMPALPALGEEDEEEPDENGPSLAPAPAPAPAMQLFRDAPASSAAPAIPSTPAGAFRPVTRTGGSSARAPLGMKAGTPLAASAGVKQPLLSVFQDAAPAAAAAQQGLEAGEMVIPSSQPLADASSTSLAPLSQEESFAEQDEFDAPLRGGGVEGDDSDEDYPANDGYSLGRRLPGQSRYAPFVEQMTPIVERTLEFTGAMSTANLGASTRSRRDSYYPTGAAATAVQEEDEEPSTEEEDASDEEGGADQAFVASLPSAQQPSMQEQQRGEDSSFQSDGDSSSSSSSEDEDDEPQQVAPTPLLPPGLASPPPAHVFAAATSSPNATANGSFDVSAASATLPEGLTIAGNQSGMTTNMHVAAGEETVNPFDPQVLAAVLRQQGSSIFEHPDVHDLRTSTADRLAGLQKTAKKRARASSGGGKDRTGVIDEAWDLELGGEVFSVREKLGEGTFGAVFRVALPLDEDDFDVDAEEELSLAVKVERPTNLWEFHILDQLHARLPARTRQSLVAPHRLYAYEDESFLFLDSCDQGTLLNAVNRAAESGVSAPAGQPGIDELLGMFFVVELLRAVEALHRNGFLHGDLKIDNCLLRLEDVPGGARAWSSTYDATGAGGWASKGVKLIDFGRTIDLAAFPTGQRFTQSFEADASDCAEMRERTPWTFEPDYYGVASVAYNVLFGRNIETHKGDDGRWTLEHQWKRYYQVELWSRLFEMLLNPRSVREDGQLPIADELGAVRAEMEEYLRVNGEKSGKSLKGLLRKLEISTMS
ncbi:protein kinase [Rhodosporidiobolus nylandii]